MEELIYIYCITEKAPEFSPALEEGDKDIYFISHKGLYAVVSEVLSDEFSEDMLKKNLNDMEWLESRIRTHERVIEKVMEQSAVIPFKFATIFKTEDNLKAMIDNYLDEFRDILKQLEGQEEWGVKIYCDMEKFKTAVVKKDEQILRVEEKISSSGVGRAYFLNKKKEELIDDIANKKITGYRMEIRETLQEHSSGARPVKLLPKEITGRKDEMILNVAFLVDKTKLKGFIDSISYLNGEYADKGLNFDCTGPWPPYNFCSITPGRSLGGSSPLSGEKNSEPSGISNGVKKEKDI